MLPSYKHRLYPNRAQAAALDGMAHAFRDLYNAALQQRIEAYRRGGVPLRCADQAGELRAVRDADERLAAFSYSAGQQVLRRLDKALVTEIGRQMETIPQTDPATAKRLRDKRYRERHSERVEARHRDYYQRNRDAVLAKRKEHYTENAERVCQEERARRVGCPERYLLGHAKKRAKALGVPFDLTVADIVIPEVCPVLGIPLRPGNGVLHPNSPTVDRIVAEKGYVKGNIAVISWPANRIKGDTTLDELRRLVDWLATTVWGNVEAEDPRGTSQECECGRRVPEDLGVRVHRCPGCRAVEDRDVMAARVILQRHFRRVGPGTGPGARSEPVAA